LWELYKLQTSKNTNFTTAVLYKVLGRHISVYYCCKTRRYCLSSCYVYMYIHLYTSVYVYRYKYEGGKSV